MEVDTNELLHRIGSVLRGISDKMDRLIAIGERVEGEVRLPSELEPQTFAGAKEPAKEPEPAWEPKVGDWVKVTRPEDWVEWRDPRWEGAMNQFDKKIGKIECEWGDCFQICGFAAPNGFRYQFHRDWLSPPEPSEPPQPEYREPVLPADAGKLCEFSDDGETWRSGYLKGFDYDEHRHQGAGWRRNQTCSADRARHRFARIKKES